MSEDNKIFDIPSSDENNIEAAAEAVVKAEEKAETVAAAVEEKPAEVKSFFNHVEEKAAEPVLEVKPLEVKPLDVKPLEVKPVETAPVEAKPVVETKPLEAAPVEPKPLEVKNDEPVVHAPLIAPAPEPAPVPAAAVAAAAAAADPKKAAKAEAAAAKKAEKEAAAAAKKAKKEEAKKTKNQEKAAEEQAKIDSCPKEYRPVSVSKYFWYVFVSFIPVVGLIFTVAMSIVPKNKNIKNFMRAILVYFIIGLILSLIALIVMVFVNGSSVEGIIQAFSYFIEELASA